MTLALCDAADACVTEARIDWGPGLEASCPDCGPPQSTQLRLNEHAYDRTYGHMFVAVPGCNVSVARGDGGDCREGVGGSLP